MTPRRRRTVVKTVGEGEGRPQRERGQLAGLAVQRQ